MNFLTNNNIRHQYIETIKFPLDCTSKTKMAEPTHQETWHFVQEYIDTIKSLIPKSNFVYQYQFHRM